VAPQSTARSRRSVASSRAARAASWSAGSAGERRLRGHDAARDPREQPGRRGGHRAGQPFRRLLPADPRADGRQRHALHLPPPAAGEHGVDVPAHAAEGLTQPAGLVLQSRAVRVGKRDQQPAVELVAVPGDPREQVR